MILLALLLLASPANAALPLLDSENTFSGAPLTVNDVTVRGGVAYLAANNRFYTYDVSDPTNVLPLGQLVTTAAAGVAVDGDLAFIADDTRFRAVDVSNPASPTQLDFLVMQEAVDVAVNPNLKLAYVANSTSIGDLVVVSYADPGNLAVVATITAVSNPQGVFYADDTLYLADGLGGMRIYDVTAATPVQTGSFSNSRFYVNVSALAGYIYLVDTSVGLTTLQATGGTPILQGTDSVIGTPKDVIANCSGLYLVTAVATSQLRVYDITDPANPVLDDTTFIGGVDVEALDVVGEVVITAGTTSAPKLALYDTGAYCADGDADGNCLCGDPCPSFPNSFPLPEPGSVGDLNADGIPNECQCGDANDNGTLDNADLSEIYGCLTEAIPAATCAANFAGGKMDANNNGAIDNNDLSRIHGALIETLENYELTCVNRPEGTQP